METRKVTCVSCDIECTVADVEDASPPAAN